MEDTFASLLKQYRKTHFRKQQDFATKIESSRSYVAALESANNETSENGKRPSRSWVEKAAKVLKLNTTERLRLLNAAGYASLTGGLTDSRLPIYLDREDIPREFHEEIWVFGQKLPEVSGDDLEEVIERMQDGTKYSFYSSSTSDLSSLEAVLVHKIGPEALQKQLRCTHCDFLKLLPFNCGIIEPGDQEKMHIRVTLSNDGRLVDAIYRITDPDNLSFWTEVNKLHGVLTQVPEYNSPFGQLSRVFPKDKPFA